MFSFLGGYQLSQSTMVSYTFLPHPSSSCKYKRREQAMLNIRHSPRVQPLLVIFIDAIDLLQLLLPVRPGIRLANSDIEEWRALGIPEATHPNLHSSVLFSIGPSTELFFSDARRTGSTSTSLYSYAFHSFYVLHIQNHTDPLKQTVHPL